ncbi:hypothetical protein [Brevibacillus brevis]|nr:hypothetical protein [Lysinibacillus sp. SDF0063]
MKQFIFPVMHTWSTTVIILLLILYIVAGNCRTVTGSYLLEGAETENAR